MRDYITTAFNLIVGLIDADKIVLLALIALGVILVWQLLSLLTNFYRKFAVKCRKISKFLNKNGLSADNYNNFLALIAKMPQEFIRGYKTFEHASYGLPSDYIKRFDSIDVELNGGILNHGKSLLKAFIYGWAIILFVLSLALLGSDATLTGFALADALVVPVLFAVLAKIVYFVFNAIKQQQYRVAVDEFNEMLDIMNDKIENNDNLPGPDILAEAMQSLPETQELEQEIYNQKQIEEVSQITDEDLQEFSEENALPQEDNLEKLTAETLPEDSSLNQIEDEQQESEDLEETEEYKVDWQEEDDALENENFSQNKAETYLEDQLTEEITNQEEDIVGESEEQIMANTNEVDAEFDQENQQNQSLNELEVVEENQDATPVATQVKESKPIVKRTKAYTNQEKEENVEEQQKRGRGRPKKVAEGDLVITNDKEFEEALQRAEKLMRKSEEALSSSQAKRVEKALKELVDAMTKYKEDH